MVRVSLLTSVASAFYFFAKFGVSSGTVENDPCRHTALTVMRLNCTGVN